MPFKRISGTLAAVIAGLALLSPACAQEIRLAQQFSMGYLQLNVMQHQKLIEKHAAALGIPNAKVSWFKFNGPTAVNEALISGNVDIGSGGVPGLLTLWARTKGTPQEVRGISALSSQPFLLNTRDPAIKTVKDFKDSDRIAVPAVRTSVQALTLQIEAAKLYGAKDFEKFDPLTVSMTPPDATVALLKGGAQIAAAFSVPPFQYMQLEDKAIHTVLNSFDVMGGSHTFTAIWTSAKFRDGNPKMYKAFIEALKEATVFVDKNPRAAAEYWIEDSKSKLPPDTAAKIVGGKQVRWTMVPENTMKFADFMASVGRIKIKPASWKDYFFPDIYDLKGS
jgi:NitT/TauT family transport system substrate-binding protein